MAKKVGGASNGGGKTKDPNAPEKPKRGGYPVPAGAGLTENWPTEAVSGTNYDPKVHKPLKKKDFSKQSLFMEYKAKMLRRQAERLSKAADRLEQNAKITGNFDATTERNLKKAKRAGDQLLDLIAQLKASGVDVNTIPGMPAMAEIEKVLAQPATPPQAA